jgi:excisionase family DNA binding protein
MNSTAGNGQALLGKAEVARQLGGVSVSFVNQLLARKALPRVRLGYRTVRIPQAAVTKYIEAHTLLSNSGTHS